MTTRTLSFVLRLEPQDDEDFIALSEGLGCSLESKVLLGKRSLPHITVLQLEADQSDAGILWSSIAKVVADYTAAIDCAGLCLLPAPDDSETWLEVSVLKSVSLAQLQSDILRAEAVKGREVFNGTGDSFRKHHGRTDRPIPNPPTATPEARQSAPTPHGHSTLSWRQRRALLT